MKTKIFALILAICCLSVILVACKDESCKAHVDENSDSVCDVCGAAVDASTDTDTDTAADTEPVTEPETKPVCEDHVDREPADRHCDVCGADVVVIYQPVAPETETRVNMETVEIPESSNTSDFINIGGNDKPMDSMGEMADYDLDLENGLGWREEDITEIVTGAESEAESESESEPETEVVGTRYDVIDRVTGNKVIDSIVIDALDFTPPALLSGTAGVDTKNDLVYPFYENGNYIEATNIGYDDTTATYTLTVSGNGTLTLDWEVNSEDGCDWLLIRLNGAYVAEVSGYYQSDERTLSVKDGDVITFSYQKDGSVSEEDEFCRVSYTYTLDPVRQNHGATVTPYDYYFVVNSVVYSKTTETADEVETDVYSVTLKRTMYTYTGKEIDSATWTGVYDEELGLYVSEDEKTLKDLWLFEGYDVLSNPAYAYLTYNGTVYIIDKETYEIKVGGSTNSFVKRPVFNFENEKFGYVLVGESIYAYDATKWVECVYVYDIPDYLRSQNFFVLNNGTLLMQASVRLPENAVSYDYYEDGYKYDLVYVIIDPAAKTATEVEFGYYIDESVDADIFTDKATNVLSVCLIEKDILNFNKIKYLVVDDSLKVLGELPVLNYQNVQIFGNGYMMLWNDVLNCEEILDAAGKHVCYIPYGAILWNGFFELAEDYYTIADGKIQSLDSVLDAQLNGEVININRYNSYLSVREMVEISVPSEEEGGQPTTEYVYNNYRVNITDKGFVLTEIGSESDTQVETLYNQAYDFGYVTRVDVYEVDEEGEFVLNNNDNKIVDEDKSYFVVYNYEGKELGNTKDAVMSSNRVHVYCYKLGRETYELLFEYWDDENSDWASKTYILR